MHQQNIHSTAVGHMPARYLLVALLLACLSTGQAVAEGGNALAAHPSPYLALHADDPVHWQQWGPEVMEKARHENKLIFVSSGYFSCHWCHVMQRESYKNKEIAAFINANFIAVKVDRELEPVLDDQLMTFIEETRGQGGWPLNVFLTPQGYPLVGVLYMPPREFTEFLQRLALRWDKDKEELAQIAAQASEIMEQQLRAAQKLTTEFSVSDLEEMLLGQGMALADETAGGFGEQNKFPFSPQLQSFLMLYDKRPDKALREFLLLSLRAMADNGLRDQVGGGFYRYTVDPNWEVPHFEKMLYDNAQLIEIYLQAAELFEQPEFTEIAFDTLDFLQQDMKASEGAYVASLSAVDEDGKEGAYYLWDKAELQKSLSADEYRAAELAWGLNRPPTVGSEYLPVNAMTIADVAGMTDTEEAEVKNNLASARQKLLQLRAKRSLPRDDKRLTAWNGLALAALAAGAQRDKGRYGAAATQLRNFIVLRLWKDGGLYRAIDDKGKSLGTGNLEDYAYVAKGLLAWAQYTGKKEDYEQAAAIVDAAWKRFYTSEGWRLAEKRFIPGQPLEHHVMDSPLPSPTATLAQVTLSLVQQGYTENSASSLRGYLNIMSATLMEQAFFHATHIGLLSSFPPEWSVKKIP